MTRLIDFIIFLYNGVVVKFKLLILNTITLTHVIGISVYGGQIGLLPWQYNGFQPKHV